MTRLLRVCAMTTMCALTWACSRRSVDIEPPRGGRALSANEANEIARIAEVAFRDVRGELPALPPRLTLILRWGTDVIPETGENGTMSLPSNIAWTVDPARDVMPVVQKELRATLAHELHHMAREARVRPATLMDRVVEEGLATAFERDFAHAAPPWGDALPEATALAWTRELLAQPPDAEYGPWLRQHPDGRRWVGMRAGTFLVDRAMHASGRTAAQLAQIETGEILRLANVN